MNSQKVVHPSRSSAEVSQSQPNPEQGEQPSESSHLAGSQSRYAPSAPLTALAEALATGERFAVSLKPCDIAGLRNFLRDDPAAARRVVFTQAMFCGTVPSRDHSWAVLRAKGADPVADPPVSMRWRGNGCPGPAVAEWADGRRVVASYNEMWTDIRWTTQFRCKICPDAIGQQADVATGDFWPGAVPAGESAGENGIIAHTPRGREVVLEAARAGYLVLRETDLATIAHTQPHHVRLRQTHRARVAAAVARGAPVPHFAHLAGAACAAQLPASELGAAFAGTLARLRASRPDSCSEFEDSAPDD